jgi:hypothetical protein
MREAQAQVEDANGFRLDFSPTFLRTVSIEAALLTGMILVGVLRVFLTRRPGIAMDGDAPPGE